MAALEHKRFSNLMQELLRAKTADSKSKILQTMAPIFLSNEREKFSTELKSLVESSELIQELVKVLRFNMQWAAAVPVWVQYILYVYSRLRCEIPIDQTQLLVEIILKMMDSGPTPQLHLFLGLVLRLRSYKLHFLTYPPLFGALKKAVFHPTCMLDTLLALTDDCAEWQYKIMEDTQLILQLIHRTEELTWAVLFNIAQHPDAKIFMPANVQEAARRCSFDMGKDIQALLCNESEQDSLLVSEEYVVSKMASIQFLLDSRAQVVVQKTISYNLLEVILPLVNLSIMEANKELLGIHLIGVLLDIMQIKHSTGLIYVIAEFLHRSQRETAKILWNLAFKESNRKIIGQKGGVQALESILNDSDDEVLVKNITGLLYMFKPQPLNPSPVELGGHVMISYNWSHQQTVFRLASALKDRGHKVWLDTEQMQGSTLESMAHAIEGAALVLMCVSQKYKDSPNCRLEGEYCMNRKVKFIPLMLQRDYKPDGWLGLIMGSKLYHKFYDEESWDTAVSGLQQEITSVLFPPKAIEAPPLAASQTLKGTLSWTPAAVLKWLKSAQLGSHCERFSSKGVTGEILLELKSILLSSPQLFFPFVERMGFTDPFDVLRLTAALRKL